MADNQKPQVQTRGYQGYNTVVPKNTTLEWSFQGEMLKLVFSEELSEAEQTEHRKYDYNNSWITCIARQKCNDLIWACKQQLKSDKTKWFESVPVANVNQFGIGLHTDENGKKSYYARLIRNIDPETLKSDLVVDYFFGSGEIISGYNPITGEFEQRLTPADSEFMLFMSDMECFVHAMSKAFNHANRVVDKTYKDIISGDIRAIGKKLGAELVSKDAAERNGVKYGQPSLFDGAAKPAETETIQSLDDIGLPFPQ